MCAFHTPHTTSFDCTAITTHTSFTAYIACTANNDYLASVFYNPHIANTPETAAIVLAAYNDLNGYASSTSYDSYAL